MARVAWRSELPFGAPGLSSPLLVDVDGDGVLDVIVGNGIEFIPGAEPGDPRAGAGAVSAFSGRDGALLWSTDVGVVDASPVLGDVTGDGVPDVVVGLRDGQALAALGLHDGSVLAKHATLDWTHSAALADIDGDGKLDAVVAAGGAQGTGPGAGGKRGQLVAATGPDLSRVWRQRLPDETYSSPAIADPGDGVQRIYVGIGGQNHFGGGFQAHVAATGEVAWAREARTGVLSSPAVADLDLDGIAEVVYGEWFGAIHAVDGATGEALWSVETSHLTWSSPAIADLNGGGADVIMTGYATPEMQLASFEAGINDEQSLLFGDRGRITAIDGRTGAQLWHLDTPGSPGTPVVADLDGDGAIEVAVAVQLGADGVYGANGGELLILDARGLLKQRISLGAGAVATPAIADLDGNGRPELVVSTMLPASVVALEFNRPATNEAGVSWLRFRGNERGTGTAGPGE